MNCRHCHHHHYHYHCDALDYGSLEVYHILITIDVSGETMVEQVPVPFRQQEDYNHKYTV